MTFKNILTWAGGLLLALGALLVAGPAMAGANIAAPGLGANSSWTIYAFGNAQAVADSMRALANFTASGTFKSMVSMIAVIGIIVVGMSSGFSSAVAKNFISYIVGVTLIAFVFFGVNGSGPLTAKVEVIDSVTGSWIAPVTVPAVVGIPAAIISTAGYEITRQIEASFSTPDALKMGQGAPFNLAASMINDATQARITDSNLASSFAFYVQDCFTIGVARGELVASTLINSTDFLNDIKFNSGVVYVNTLLSTPVGSNEVVTCTAAWTLLKASVDAQGSGAADYLKNASAWAKTPALSVVNSSADAVAQWATNNGVTNGGALVKQAAVLAAFSGAYRQSAQATGNSEFLTALSVTQAQEAQRNSWVMGAEIFNKTMGYIFAILQVFVYSITPLILAAALVPGLGLALIKNFGQILLWLAIWQPMLAIVNFIILSMQQADLGGVLNSGNGTYGFTMASMGIVTEKTSNMRAAATFIGTMVPALAWAMVKGSIDFSRVIGSAVGENFAQQAGNTATTGNYSLNQASMDSFTANKNSIGSTGDWGQGYTSTGQGSFNHKADQGGVAGIAANGSQVGVSNSQNTGVTAGKQISDGTSATSGNARAQAAATTLAALRSGSIQFSGSSAAIAAQTKALQVLAGANWSAGGGNPAGAGGVLGGAPTGAAGAMAAATAAPPGDLAKNSNLSKLIPKVQATASLTGALSNTTNQTDTKTGTRVASGTDTRTGTTTNTNTDGINKNDGVTNTEGSQTGVSRNVTGLASLAEMASANAPYSGFESSLTAHRRGAAGSDEARWARGENSSNVSKAAQQLATPGAVDTAANKVDTKAGEKEEKLNGQLAKDRKAAAAEKATNEQDARDLKKKGEAAQAGASAAAHTSLTSQVLKKGGELIASVSGLAEGVGQGLADKAKELAPGVVAAATAVGTKIADKAKDVAPGAVAAVKDVGTNFADKVRSAMPLEKTSGSGGGSQFPSPSRDAPARPRPAARELESNTSAATPAAVPKPPVSPAPAANQPATNQAGTPVRGLEQNTQAATTAEVPQPPVSPAPAANQPATNQAGTPVRGLEQNTQAATTAEVPQPPVSPAPAANQPAGNQAGTPAREPEQNTQAATPAAEVPQPPVAPAPATQELGLDGNQVGGQTARADTEQEQNSQAAQAEVQQPENPVPAETPAAPASEPAAPPQPAAAGNVPLIPKAARSGGESSAAQEVKEKHPGTSTSAK